jgi:Glycosyl hydrolases family 2, TIM barrel domain
MNRKTSTTLAVCLLALSVRAGVSFAELALPAVHIVIRSGGYTLLRNGQPFFIKGAGGSSPHWDEAVMAGANSIRQWSPDEKTLERVRRQGSTALVGLALGIPRQGFDYRDPAAVQKQLEKTIAVVHHLKTNPAVLIWALGNEVELGATDEQRITAWKALEQLARAVKREDPSHPVILVLAGAGQNKLRELDEYCPSLDAVGINTYGGILSLPEMIAAQGFRRPYLVTEFGPRGHWEVAKTAWGVPIEDTSTQKAALIAQGYEHAIAHQPQCLGSYVFLWGQKQEKTPTWYGLFLEDGAHVGGVDTMQYLWTGQWPAHRAPIIDGTIVAKSEDADGQRAKDVFRPGTRIVCSLKASDPEGNPVTVQWEVRPDVANNPSRGGDFEPSAAPLAGAVEQQNGPSAVIRVPENVGDYRVFAYVHNQYRAAATANLPIEAK